MFKLCAFVVSLALVGAQNPNDAFAEVSNIRSEPNQGDGAYSYAFDTTNGISQQESGVGGHSVQGSASWYAPNGEPVQFSYIADEFGFRATGSHLPLPPPIPEAIQRSLDYIRANPSIEAQSDYDQHQQQPQYYQPQQQQPQRFFKKRNSRKI